MKPLILTKSIVAAAAFVLLGGVAFAQTATTTPSPAPSDSSVASGLLGSRYAGLEYGYLRFDQPRAPRSGHEFNAYYNQPLQPGLDLNVALADESTGYFGTRPRTDELLAGLTAYQPVNSWIKPFISGQAGIAFERDAELFSSSGILSTHNSSDYFDYVLAAGAEFQLMPALVATPFVSYQEIHEISHEWNYGVKVTYRLARAWSVSLTPEIDEHHTLGYKAGVNFHF